MIKYFLKSKTTAVLILALGFIFSMVYVTLNATVTFKDDNSIVVTEIEPYSKIQVGYYVRSYHGLSNSGYMKRLYYIKGGCDDLITFSVQNLIANNYPNVELTSELSPIKLPEIGLCIENDKGRVKLYVKDAFKLAYDKKEIETKLAELLSQSSIGISQHEKNEIVAIQNFKTW